MLQAKSGTLPTRLIPFSVSVNTSFILEFGDHYLRFINNGAPVLEPNFAITGVNNGLPATITAPGNNFVPGDVLFITGVVGMPAINGRFVQVASAGTNVVVTDLQGNFFSTATFGTYLSGGVIARVFQISTPYPASDLALLKYVESVSVLFLTHPSHPVQTLTFFAPTNWVIAPFQFGTQQAAPTISNVAFTPGNSIPPSPAFPGFYAYVVTAVDSSGEESLPSNVFNSNTGSFDAVEIAAGTNTITVSPPGSGPPAGGYNVYKAEVSFGGSSPPPGVAFGFIGIITPSGTQFIDSNITPDFSVSPPIVNNNPFIGTNNFPGVCSFFQQRLFLGSTNNNPATFWASQPGVFNNFNFSDPIQASDFIQGTIVSTQLNSIRSMIPMPGGLINLTGKAAFTLATGQGTNATLAVTPENATIVPQAYNGASDVIPLVINEDILYVQAKGSIVRDLSYNIYAAIYTGTDISIRSNHLFFNHLILQWTWAEEPFKIVWAIRDDGILLSLSFVKEQQISGWARHDTQGFYKSVASVQEGQADATYFVVQRTLPDGTVVQWIERQAERTFAYGAEDAFSVDAGTGNRFTLPTPAANLVIFPAVAGVTNAVFDATVSVSPGQVLRAGGGIFTILSVTSPTQVTMQQTQAIDESFTQYNIPIPFAQGTWTLATPETQFFGLDYLAGQVVTILADGGVVASQVVAADGSITLPQPATKVVAGLAYTCQMQTMPLDVGEPTVQGKRKKIGALNLKIADTQALQAGRTFQTLIYVKEPIIPVVPLGSPKPLQDGDARIVIDPLWDVQGQICIQVSDPLPASVLGVIPEIVIGDTK